MVKHTQTIRRQIAVLVSHKLVSHNKNRVYEWGEQQYGKDNAKQTSSLIFIVVLQSE